MELVGPALERLLDFLAKPPEEPYQPPNDFFLKDVRFAAGWTVPAGAQVVDLRANLGREASRSIIRRRPSIRLAARYLRDREITPWFRPHTEARYTDEFNEEGWDRTYLRIAALLNEHCDVAGMCAYAWFYDPQLDEISPRLSYLRKRPIERGAILLPGGTSEADIRNATATSGTRRRLYEAGQYMPVAHQVVWLRDDILRWAETT